METLKPKKDRDQVLNPKQYRQQVRSPYGNVSAVQRALPLFPVLDLEVVVRVVDLSGC